MGRGAAAPRRVAIVGELSGTDRGLHQPSRLQPNRLAQHAPALPPLPGSRPGALPQHLHGHPRRDDLSSRRRRRGHRRDAGERPMIWTGAPPVTRGFLALTLSILAVRLALIRRFVTAIAVQSAVPMHDHFFPWILREPIVLATAFFVPLATELLVLRRPTPRRMRISAVTVM